MEKITNYFGDCLIITNVNKEKYTDIITVSGYLIISDDVEIYMPNLLKTDGMILNRGAKLNSPGLKETKNLTLDMDSVLIAPNLTQIQDITLSNSVKFEAPELEKAYNIILHEKSIFIAPKLMETQSIITDVDLTLPKLLKVDHICLRGAKLTAHKLTDISNALILVDSELYVPKIKNINTINLYGGKIKSKLLNDSNYEILGSKLFTTRHVKFIAVDDLNITITTGYIINGITDGVLQTKNYYKSTKSDFIGTGETLQESIMNLQNQADRNKYMQFGENDRIKSISFNVDKIHNIDKDVVWMEKTYRSSNKNVNYETN